MLQRSMREDAQHRRRPRIGRIPLVWRLFAANAAVLCVAGLALVLSPVTVSSPVLAWELAAITGGLAVMLLVNLWLVRRTLLPLERLRREMERVDLLRPGRRVHLRHAADPDVGALADAFDAMLDRLEDERRASAGRAISAQEDERRRVARELHDGVGQTLTGLLLQLERASRSGGDGPPGIVEAREDARASLEEVRRIARQLRPATLDDLGLVTALDSLATTVSAATDLPVRRRFANDLPELSREEELAVYRVAQESLTNVVRHARATEVELRLEHADGGVRLIVRDDGVGLEVEEGASGGLRWMRERAVLVGAVLTVRSAPSTGTSVELVVPRPPARATEDRQRLGREARAAPRDGTATADDQRS